ncbi:MAG: DegV family protein [Lysobacteraceae bacterium]
MNTVSSGLPPDIDNTSGATVAAAAPLTAPALRRALIAGARRVIAARDGLNRINVFPVADGDTGNNLAFTLGSVLNGALSRRSRHIGELLKRIGDDAIDGARGNSGAILAQFLHGVAEHARAQPSLDAQTLAAAVRHGADSARSALAHPVEGTIISVIDSFADAMEESAAQLRNDPRGGFNQALAQARRALARTPQQMALLQRAGVVDAGAQGFVDLLEGIGEFVEGGPRAMRLRANLRAANETIEDEHGHDDHSHPAHDAVDPDRRWCTECLLLVDSERGTPIARDALRTALESIGADSMVLAGGGTRMRVHAHVGAPQRLFDACAAFATVEGMKADDMLLQSRSIDREDRVAVVTDSAADLPETIAERYAVHVVPVRVNLDDRDYLDKIGLATGEFYRRMAVSRQLPRTSQPPPGDFRRHFDFLASHHPDVVYVGLSRAISGTLQSAEHAAARGESAECRAKVRVFDSINAAGGQGLLAWRAAEMADDGADADAILRELERLRPRTLTWAMGRDIRHAVRGGRIPGWAEPAVRLTGLTPVAKVKADGKLGIAGGLIAKAKAPEAFAGYVARRVRKTLGADTRLRAIVGHCDALADGERLLAALRKRLDLVEAHLVETGPAIGAHAGRGTLVASFQPAPE